ncbi:MAG: hypothetical protein PWP03_195 [Candidatus Woesearchaeota archaeon]|nr:hypothetical protein [Candidatus Woesearchaeota archaeon]
MIMEHYFTEKPKSKKIIKEIEFQDQDLSFSLLSASGLFSKDKVDLGTKVLLKYNNVTDNSRVLDLGCGYGIVGIYLAKKFQNIKVVMSDINERAVEIAKLNVKKHNLSDRIKVVKSDGFNEINGTFDYILLNPPQTAGKDVCFKLIEGSFDHLKEGGYLNLVARHKKGGATLMEKMNEVFNNVQVLGKKSGFRVYASKR